MQAIILAAGMGRRLKDFAKCAPKCMVKVNNVSLIERILRQLDRLSLKRIVIVVGYQKEVLIDFINTLKIKTPIIFETNSDYENTNNIYSLFLARDYLSADDTLLIESDLIVEDSILEDLCSDSRPNIALVDKYKSWMDGTCVVTNKQDEICRFILGKNFQPSESSTYYKTVNIYKMSRNFSKELYVPFLTTCINTIGRNEYYEQVIGLIAYLDKSQMLVHRLSGQKWYEIDNKQDLAAASRLFS